MKITGWKPSFIVLLFLLHPLVVLLQPDRPLLDPGTPWHLVTGRIILDQKALPQQDPFSFSVPDQTRLLREWLFQTVIATLEAAGGLPLVTAACTLLYALLPCLLFHRMLREDADLIFALLLALAAYFVLLPHALVRPHIFTYLFFILFLEALGRFERGTKPAIGLWWLPVVMILWTNLHGGFLVGLVAVGAYSFASLVPYLQKPEATAGNKLKTYSALLAACSLATLINPYGWTLVPNLLSYLSLTSLSFWQEFQPPNFVDGGSAVRLYGLFLLLSLGLVVFRKLRLTLAEWLLFLFLVYQSLQAVRHMNLVVLLITPALAQGLTTLQPAWLRRFDSARLAQSHLSSHWIFIPLLAVCFLIFSQQPSAPFRRDFLDLRLTRGASDFIARQPERFTRLYNPADLGGALIYQFYPRLQVFMDDRTEIYQDAFILNRYLPVAEGRSNWSTILEDYHVTSAITGVHSPLAARLQNSDAWARAYQDSVLIIYLKK